MAKLTNESGTIIAENTAVRGKIKGAQRLLVAGRVEGSIELDDALVVQKGGVVKANVSAKTVLISGILVGDITASESVEIGPEGRMKGDIRAPTVRIAEGARFAGGLDVGDPEARRSAVPRTPVSFVRPAPIAAKEVEIEEEEEDHETALPGGPSFVRGPITDERRRKRIVVKKRS